MQFGMNSGELLAQEERLRLLGTVIRRRPWANFVLTSAIDNCFVTTVMCRRRKNGDSVKRKMVGERIEKRCLRCATQAGRGRSERAESAWRVHRRAVLSR